MFLPYRVAVKEHLVEGSNRLVLTFPSTFVKGKHLVILTSVYSDSVHANQVGSSKRSMVNSAYGTATLRVSTSVPPSTHMVGYVPPLRAHHIRVN